MATPKNRRNETEQERRDRQLMELLQGFRVAVTGVQVLFAFLLTLPFATRFHTVDDTGRVLFYIALFGAAVASICFIAPAIQHRILFQAGQKPLLIRRANRFGIAAALALAISITAATTLIVQTLTDGWATVATAAVVGLLASWAWFVQPLLTRRAVDRAGHPDDDGDGREGRETEREAEREDERADEAEAVQHPLSRGGADVR
ncbi:hypothetical protein GCM10009678_58260 [Actinomadura kijaniata]|uniref:Uncharacterized protein n=1 Tax=Actinomadura namibiensis TaxID=182080 RepID=A0A7W3QRJ5_ACTNM|nr:DUF6328 family protein [Actinomadura namibiensis]MBA8956682.1 hypothetical protein [Actinomadura namibiensis]